MSTTKIAGLLCVILCLFYSKASLSQGNPAYFTFTLKSTSSTSAGVYKKDSTLVRILWANKTYSAGTFTDFWDGKDDYGNTIAAPDAAYDIKVLSNNVVYNWDGIIGNTSLSQTGSGVHRGYYTSMTGMAITGNTAYFCQGYSEAYSSEAKFDINSPQVRLNVFGGQVSTMNADFVVTDGTNVYWGGYDAYKPANSFIHVTKVSDDSQVSFGANGSSYTMQQIGSPKTYTSVIDKLNVPKSKPSGLAIQKSGNYLFVAHSGLNELHVIDKTTGATVQTLAFTTPRFLSTDGNYLWMVTGTNTISKYLVNANGTLSAATLSLTGVTIPGAIQANGSGTIGVIDQTNQVVRFFNTSTGAEGTQLGVNGGYSNSPDVTNTKFMFDDLRGNTFGFLAYAPDGSFWLGDCGNQRELHFSSNKNYIETIMSLGVTYSTCVDPNNITRVFANYMEFAIDYSKPLTGNSGWAYVRNWGYNSAAINLQSTKRLLSVITLSNGRTYGYDYAPGMGLVELTTTGLRSTGVNIYGYNYSVSSINTDGSLTKFSGSYNTGNNITYTSYPLTGFSSSGNPIWASSGTMLATTPPNTMKDPNNFPGNVSPVSFNFLTTTNKVIFYNPSLYYAGTGPMYDGYHLGAIKKGTNKWLWETQKANHLNYKGAFPKTDCFEIGNNVNQDAGSNVNVLDNNIITGYHGEAWKNSQTNYYNHYYEDGLAIGQFGYDRYLGSSIAGYGVAGNALSPTLVKDNATGDLYLYHGDESIHAGIHRWKISNLSSISEQYISVPFPSNYTRVSVGYLDLHSGLPFDSPLSSVAGWSKTGTVVSNTSLKKYVNDGSPDVFSQFNQTSGIASVQRDLGTNTVTNSWKISGQVSFEGSDFSSGSQTMAYVDVLDAAGKILTRFYYTNNHATGVTTVYGNSQVIAQSNASISSVLGGMQPFEVNIVNNKLTFLYANYPAVAATIFDPTANWKSPKTLRAYFVSGFPAYGKNIGLMDMKFYKDYNQAINIPPVANAGADQAITLPLNTVTLSGSGTDVDGTIVSYAWTKLSGPSSGVISNATNFTTTATGLTQGTYTFELKVTDNIGASGVDTVQIIVNAAANIPPVANAGADQAITLPINTVTLTGTGTDTDGSITKYSWTKISGPSSGVITNSNNGTTTVTGLVQGSYNFELKVTDNSGATALDTMKVTVNAAANIPPVANAGADQAITLPVNSVTLNGTGTDADGSITKYSWTKISGPASGTITNLNSATTTVKNLVQGTYNFELKVTDNSGASGVDTIQILVNPPANIPPVANAGLDQVITLPANVVSLAGSGGDADGSIVAYAWRKISGSSSYNIVNPSSPVTDISGLIGGTYSFELKVTDNSGATAKDTVQVTVNLAPNITPVVDAGSDQMLVLPKNRAVLDGAAGDPDGSVVSYLWKEIAGPPSASIGNANSASTVVSNLTQGDYLFELSVTDDLGGVGKDTVQITVVASTLPLKLLSFTGKVQNDFINLFWETTNERNVLGFEIERMNAANWNKIEFVPANNSGLISNQYMFTDSFPAIGSNYYRLKIIDVDGRFIYSDIISFEVNPRKNLIYQNFPNPLSNFTTIKFEIAQKASVKVIVYNSIGMQVAVLLNEIKQPGVYKIEWNASNVAQGDYFYKVIVGESVVTNKMVKIY
ncbi:MAG: Ig-like domain-containing protein [Ginsengibacter sp.]